MPKPVFTVTTLLPSRSGYVWWSVEADEGADIDAIYATLKNDGLLRCTRLNSEPDGDRRVIRGREPVILGKGIIGTIAPAMSN